ncbi:TPA: hypothetical protein L7651_000579 [Klebsiella pneumoniae subsp. pneumoniae]|uniref:hypothetical protein n=1 Tax=Klebsiella pneumoniae TaxID=573 RepID=UPI001911A67C|nr:hypothetical protein [Klebsiella pneumoniae]HBQ6081283.1 hypothetical protein [Klebsiella pneumoniae subsp. pneumoniae]EKJ5234442.1 hypothetical protein [Klebsiella pneumoniae]EKV7523565.1 hypothetical protein [Klebsiella pneumoniae]EKW8848577.1 hypothetical protein [Klebsiella pneumoniae]EKW8855211.1 hypothetical protein [Klebsiella pneumoniae]
MSDITELALREKFEAWWEREYKHLESSKYTDTVPHIKYGFWMAYQAGGAELVEALEKAQAQSSKWLEAYHKAVSIGARYEERIAELESRTVTVKLPQRFQPGADGWDDWYVHSDDEGEYLKFDDVLAMLTAAGIKVEAE